MITSDHWDELIDWLEQRLPEKPWHPEQATAYFFDMRERFDMTDVWTAVFRMYDKGQRFTPNGSQLIAATIEVARRSAIDDLYRRELPVDTEPPSTWEQTTMNRFGKRLTVQEAIVKIHRDKPCNTKTCDIHYPKVDA